MMSRRNTPLQVATKGVLAGMGGALILTGVVSLARAMSSSRERRPADGTGITAGEALSEDPGLPPQISQVTALFVEKVATGIFGTSLNREQQYVAGVGWHLAYGGFWGAGYGLVRGSVRTSTLALIPVHGLLVW